MENLNIDQSTLSQRFVALEIQIRNRTRILELIRKWHLGANDPTISSNNNTKQNSSNSSKQQPHQQNQPSSISTPDHQSNNNNNSTPGTVITSVDSCPTSPMPKNNGPNNRFETPDRTSAANQNDDNDNNTSNNSLPSSSSPPPQFCRLSSLFFGCMYVSRNQLCEWFESSEDGVFLVQKMFNYGMGVGGLLSDSALSGSSPAADFLFHLFEMHLEIQVDGTASHQLPPIRMYNQRTLRKDREERLGENLAAALRPVPRHLDKEGPTRPARFSSDSFLFHEANRPDVHLPMKSIDYFSVCLGFVQTMLLCYRRLLDAELCKNTMALKRFVTFDEQLEESVMKPLFKELRALVDYLLNHADNEMMTALAAI